jgi:hypothetical protein
MSSAKKFSLESMLGIALPGTFIPKKAVPQKTDTELPVVAEDGKAGLSEHEFTAKILPFGKSIEAPEASPQEVAKSSGDEQVHEPSIFEAVKISEELARKNIIKDAIEIYNEMLNASYKVKDSEDKDSGSQLCGTLINKKHY